MSRRLSNETGNHPANIGPRLGAGLIDFFILFMQYNVVVFLFSVASLGLTALGRALPVAVRLPISQLARGVYLAGWVWAIGVAVAYFPFWWGRAGQTFGMRMLRLRIARTRGPEQAIGYGRALVRGIVSAVGLLALGAGFWWVALDGRRQGWADKVAGTLVVRTERDPA